MVAVVSPGVRGSASAPDDALAAAAELPAPAPPTGDGAKDEDEEEEEEVALALAWLPSRDAFVPPPAALAALASGQDVLASMRESSGCSGADVALFRFSAASDASFACSAACAAAILGSEAALRTARDSSSGTCARRRWVPRATYTRGRPTGNPASRESWFKATCSTDASGEQPTGAEANTPLSSWPTLASLSPLAPELMGGRAGPRISSMRLTASGVRSTITAHAPRSWRRASFSSCLCVAAVW